MGRHGFPSIPRRFGMQLPLVAMVLRESSALMRISSISIKQNIFKTNVYDKRDNFNFKIVNFPFLNSNIPTRPAYGVYMSQLVRIGRISSFVKRHYTMTSKLVNQDFWYCKLCRTFKRIYKKYP